MTYTELEALAPEAYLNPDNFRTEYDGRNPARAAEQYRIGLETSQGADTIIINYKSVWGAKMLSGGHLQSYEGIGYHGETAALLRGFLDGPARIVVMRWYPSQAITETEIKPSTR